MSSTSKMVGGVLVALLAVGGLTACGQASTSLSGAVSCKNATFDVAKTQADTIVAEQKAEESAGTPGEKQAKTKLSELNERLTALKACDDETATASDTQDCKDQFVQKLDKNAKFRFVSSGFKGTATEKREQLVDALGHDYRYLAFVGEQLFHENIVEKSLVDGGCLSTEGQILHAKAEGALMAAGVKNGKASADSYNTGMEDGKAVVSKDKGIRGDRSATIYTLADGTKVVVLDRCGNMALPSKPKGTPPGKTDNPPPVKECPPGQHGTPPVCKDGPERQRTNADGAGKNATSGPGAYVAPKDMDRPPSTPRVNPTQPKPKPPSNPTKPKPKPEPTFTHPAPEPSAPKPDKPETGCKVPPGMPADYCD